MLKFPNLCVMTSGIDYSKKKAENLVDSLKIFSKILTLTQKLSNHVITKTVTKANTLRKQGKTYPREFQTK